MLPKLILLQRLAVLLKLQTQVFLSLRPVPSLPLPSAPLRTLLPHLA